MARDGYVAAPDKALRVIARDEHSTGGFTFQESTEVGRLSSYSEHLLRSSHQIVFAGPAIITGVAVFGYLGTNRMSIQ